MEQTRRGERERGASAKEGPGMGKGRGGSQAQKAAEKQGETQARPSSRRGASAGEVTGQVKGVERKRRGGSQNERVSYGSVGRSASKRTSLVAVQERTAPAMNENQVADSLLGCFTAPVLGEKSEVL